MILADIAHNFQSLGTFQRKDKAAFQMMATLYETPAEYSYWLAHIKATHEAWGDMKFTLLVLKEVTGDLNGVRDLLRTEVRDQICSELEQASASGRQMTLVGSFSRWVLT